MKVLKFKISKVWADPKINLTDLKLVILKDNIMAIAYSYCVATNSAMTSTDSVPLINLGYILSKSNFISLLKSVTA